MSNSIIDVNESVVMYDSVNIENDNLRTMTNEILFYAANMRTQAKIIAARLVYIHDYCDELCAEFEGETDADKFITYGEQILGIKRAQLYAYVRVGQQLLDENGKSVLFIPSGYNDYTMTQLQALLPLSVEKSQELAYDGVIKPDMTVKQIKEIVADNRPDADEKRYAKEEKRREKERIEEEQARIEHEEYIKKHGELIASFSVSVKPDNTYIVIMNDDDITASRIGKYLISNVKKMNEGNN